MIPSIFGSTALGYVATQVFLWAIVFHALVATLLTLPPFIVLGWLWRHFADLVM